jgi:HPt (histidine-containing phosphotransfer) domain-containing protein
LATFREGYRACLHKAHRAMTESNLPELSRAAHTIKGMLRNLSMNSAARTAAALEKSAQDAAEKESAELLLNLEGDLAKILPEVEAPWQVLKHEDIDRGRRFAFPDSS